MWDFISGMWDAFIPPMDSDAGKQYNWRLRVGIFTCCATVGLGLLAAAVYGWIPKVERFAHPSEIAALQNSINMQIQGVNDNIGGLREDREKDAEDRLKTEMLSVNSLHCKTKGVGRTLYAQRLSEMQDKYTKLTKRVFPLPVCGDL